MRRYVFAAGMLVSLFLSLYGCGGGGGGGGPSTTTTKLYLFGTLSTNRNVATVQTSIAVAGFSSYSAPAGVTSGVFPLRRGIFSASGPVVAGSVASTYDTASQKLNLSISNSLFKNMSASKLSNGGKGTEIGRLVMPAAVAFPSAMTDYNPSVQQFRLVPSVELKVLGGCQVNYAP